MATTNRLSSQEITPIQIRVRQVFSGRGETATAETVYCPTRERSVDVRACRVCGHSQGFSECPGDRSVFCDSSKARDLTLRQVLRHRTNLPDRTRVGELMTTHVLCVTSDVSLEALSRLLIERKISAVPVVDERGAPLGMISKTDLVQFRYESAETGTLDESLEPGFHESRVVEGTVADAMVPVQITFYEDATISQVAAAMAYERIHSLPIVGEDGTVVGIVSTLDIVGWYAQREGYVLGSMSRAKS